MKRFTLDYIRGLFVVLDPNRKIKFSTIYRRLAIAMADELNGELQ